MVSAAPCPGEVKLRGLSLGGMQSSAPVIIQRSDQEFLQAVLDELSAEGGLDQLAGDRRLPPAPGEPLRLYQPIHRTFNLALLEVACDCYGQPRLDPQRILSAGLVVRREGTDPQGRVPGRLSGGGKELALSEKNRLAKQVAALLARRAEVKAQAVSAGTALEEIELGTASELASLAGKAYGWQRAPAMEGWMQSSRTLQGWMPFDDEEHERLDPDPGMRRPAKRAGHPFIDQLLSATSQAPLSEAEVRLFIAPPESAAASGKTILYGLIPTTSSEQAETPDPSMPPFADELVSQHLPSYLRAGGPRSLPRAGQYLDYSAADTSAEDIKDTSDTDDLSDFIGMLRQLAVEFEAFKAPLESNPVYQALNQLKVPYTLWSDDNDRYITYYQPAGEFLKYTLDILVNQIGKPKTSASPTPSNPPTVLMPDNFPQVSKEQAAAILSEVKKAMIRRLAQVAGRPGRFDDPGRRYRVRAFVRLKGEGDCPPVTVWSDYSEPFTIVPWYEASGTAPTQVALPEITPDFLQKVKPNVSFVLPESLFNLINKNSPKDFLGGKAAPAGSNIALDWICSFNIPIITICAFIALNIFLSLFDLIFQWMMYIKICIPFPKSQQSSQGGPP